MTVYELIKKLTVLRGNMEVVVVDNEGNVQDIAAFTRGSWIPQVDDHTDGDGLSDDDEAVFIQDEVEGALAAIVIW